MKCVVFFVPGVRAFSNSVLHSQVFEQVRVLASLGLECHFLGSDISSAICNDKANKFTHEYGFSSFKVFPYYPLDPSYNSLQRTYECMLDELPVLDSLSPDVVYIRDLLLAEKVLKNAKPRAWKLLYDCRGAVSAEARGRTGNDIVGFIKSMILQGKEKYVFKNADLLACVSEGLKEWIFKQSGRTDTTVIPCCTNHNIFKSDPGVRVAVREELGWPLDIPIVAYVGGADYWQRGNEVINLLAKVQQALPELKLLILTGAEGEFTRLVMEAGINIDNVFIKKVSHSEVPYYLQIADAGIILRHDILLNQVASPIKVVEYMALGLCVIASNGIGDFSGLIKKFDAGLILDEPLDSEQLLKLLRNGIKLNACGERARELSKNYSWESVKKTYKSLYGIRA